MRSYGPLVLMFAAAAASAAPEVPTKAPPPAAMKSPASDAAPPDVSPSERARRLLDEALVSLTTARKLSSPDTDVIARFRAAAEMAKDSVPALFDYAVALDRAGTLVEAEAAYRAAAGARGM
ncbi:MAG: hypothetical protein E6J85_16435, partial [Deltaproteobacteria bacterium]